LTRAILHELGYPAPELQVSFSDSNGAIGKVDFYWPSARVIGEFDGMVKYERPEYLSGKTPSQIVVLEKLREDRLRRNVRGMFRCVWEDARHPSRLDSIVRSSGLTKSERPTLLPRART
jgi:hypothetical protein